MDTKQVGPFVVRAVTIGEGFDLLPLLSDNPTEFQKQLILKTVTRDGQSITSDSMKSLIPHLADLVTAAMVLNGLSDEE
jgi:hypothetical protein